VTYMRCDRQVVNGVTRGRYRFPESRLLRSLNYSFSFPANKFMRVPLFYSYCQVCCSGFWLAVLLTMHSFARTHARNTLRLGPSIAQDSSHGLDSLFLSLYLALVDMSLGKLALNFIPALLDVSARGQDVGRATAVYTHAAYISMLAHILCQGSAPASIISPLNLALPLPEFKRHFEVVFLRLDKPSRLSG
jgi:hypothetical protein